MSKTKLAHSISSIPYTPRTGPTDSELVKRYLAGDERAFTEIVKLYERRLQRFIYSKIGDREQSEDLVQETFVRIHRHVHRFDHSKQFMTWIYTIAHNLAKNELRNRARNSLVYLHVLTGNWDNDNSLEFEDPKAQTDALYTNNHLRELIYAAVAKLPQHHKEVFVLRELEGRSYEVIGEIVGCGLGTVKSRLNRARVSFAELIEPFID